MSILRRGGAKDDGFSKGGMTRLEQDDGGETEEACEAGGGDFGGVAGCLGGGSGGGAASAGARWGGGAGAGHHLRPRAISHASTLFGRGGRERGGN